MMWGRTAGYIDQYAPPDKRNPDVFQVWPKTTARWARRRSPSSTTSRG